MSRLIIDLPPDLDPSTARGIVYDALTDFARVRYPAAPYVATRYADNPDLNTPAKVRQVEERVNLALSFRVEVER